MNISGAVCSIGNTKLDVERFPTSYYIRLKLESQTLSYIALFLLSPPPPSCVKVIFTGFPCHHILTSLLRLKLFWERAQCASRAHLKNMNTLKSKLHSKCRISADPGTSSIWIAHEGSRFFIIIRNNICVHTHVHSRVHVFHSQMLPWNSIKLL